MHRAGGWGWGEGKDPSQALPPVVMGIEDEDGYQGFFVICLFICLFAFRAAPMTYGGSQARGRIEVVAADLCHSHSNTGSIPHL